MQTCVLDWLYTGGTTFLYRSEVLLGVRNLNGDKTEGVIIFNAPVWGFLSDLFRERQTKDSQKVIQKNMPTTEGWYGHLHAHSYFLVITDADN